MSELQDKDVLILKILREREGEVVSGEELAIILGISRVALRKRIYKLKEEGIPIKVVDRKGYVLESVPDILIPPLVLSELNTEVIGTKYLFFEVVDSTNLLAKNMAAKGEAEGTVIAADYQTKGRGRLGRKWFSPKGKNLYFSVILRPPVSAALVPQLTMLSSVAVCEALRDMGVDALIKWPNDVFVKGRKICGILNEMEIKGGKVDFVILGIGLNVNVKEDDFPSDLRNIATSLSIELGYEVSRREVFVRILELLDKWYVRFLKGERKELFYFWREHNYTLGKRVLVDGKLEGFAIGVTPYGELLIRSDDGEVVKVSAGDVDIIN